MLVRDAIAQLLADPGSPAAHTRAQRAIWAARASEQVVPECPFTSEELAAAAAAGRQIGYLPPQLSGAAGRSRLAQIFPQMSSFALHPGAPFTNDVDVAGWFDYDAGPDAPNTDLDEPTLLARLEDEGRRLLTLNQYIIAAQDTKLLTGHYPDERRTWTRVGTRQDGGMIMARFDGPEMAEGMGDEDPVDGSLLIAYDVEAGDHFAVLGARTGPLCPPLGQPDPVDERARIIDAYLRAGFATALGLSAEQYAATLPAIGAIPPHYRGTFDLPLIVETRIPWREQAARLGVGLSGSSLRNEYVAVDSARPAPQQPYAAWFTAWGQRFPAPTAPDDALAQLRPELEVGRSLIELLAMEAAHPEFTASGRFFDVIGAVGRDLPVPGLVGEVPRLRTACIYHWRGRPEIGANLHPLAFPIFRPLVRGSETNSNVA